MDNTPKYVVIVAGGNGLRMGTEIPKQFLELGGIPVLMHTIKKFHDSFSDITVKLVLPEIHQDYWQKLCLRYSFTLSHDIVSGGKSRFQSVKNGLESIPSKEGIVAIHDGVRPFVSKDIILKSFLVAATSGNATVSVPMKDSIRVIENDVNRAVDRNSYCIIQTPQTFRLDLIKKAFDIPELPGFTDDASVFEKAGHKIILIEGSYENIKITTPEDMVLGEVLLKRD
jgi:2-C-methyl-D-erythritol 4-phosphate cytidylyltransferase